MLTWSVEVMAGATLGTSGVATGLTAEAVTKEDVRKEAATKSTASVKTYHPSQSSTHRTTSPQFTRPTTWRSNSQFH